ncbi:hypothetical protein BHE74_00033366 [Ensete ventricosum]|nr:hypothetical protein BHE74_00033366 [Ensete ventricosum]
MAETYGRRAAAVAWDGGMGRHTALMGMGHAMSCSDTSTSDSRSDRGLWRPFGSSDGSTMAYSEDGDGCVRINSLACSR